MENASDNKKPIENKKEDSRNNSYYITTSEIIKLVTKHNVDSFRSFTDYYMKFLTSAVEFQKNLPVYSFNLSDEHQF